MIEYKIIESYYKEDFEQIISKYLSDGWKCEGGISEILDMGDMGSTWYSQAITRGSTWYSQAITRESMDSVGYQGYPAKISEFSKTVGYIPVHMRMKN